MSETLASNNWSPSTKSSSQYVRRRTNSLNPPPVCFNCGVTGHFVVACPEPSRESSAGSCAMPVPVSGNFYSSASYLQHSNPVFPIQPTQNWLEPHYQQYSGTTNQICGNMNPSQNYHRRPFNTTNSVFSHNSPNYHFAPLQGPQIFGHQHFITPNYISQSSACKFPASSAYQTSAPSRRPKNLISGYQGLSIKHPTRFNQSSKVAPNYQGSVISLPAALPRPKQERSTFLNCQSQESFCGTSASANRQKNAPNIQDSLCYSTSKPTTLDRSKTIITPQTLHCKFSHREISPDSQTASKMAANPSKIPTTKIDTISISSQDQYFSPIKTELNESVEDFLPVQGVDTDIQKLEDYDGEGNEDFWEWDYDAIFKEPPRFETVELAQPLAVGFKSTPVPLLQAWSSSAPSISRYARKDNLKEFIRTIRSSPQWSYLQEDPAFSDEKIDGPLIPFDEISNWATNQNETEKISDSGEDDDAKDSSHKRSRSDDSRYEEQNLVGSKIRIQDSCTLESPPAKKQKHDPKNPEIDAVIEIFHSPTQTILSDTSTLVNASKCNEPDRNPNEETSLAKNPTEALLESLGVTGSPKPRKKKGFLSVHLDGKKSCRNLSQNLHSAQNLTTSSISSNIFDNQDYRTAKYLLTEFQTSEQPDSKFTDPNGPPIPTYQINTHSEEPQHASSIFISKLKQQFKPHKNSQRSNGPQFYNISRDCSLSRAQNNSQYKYQASFPHHESQNWHNQSSQGNQIQQQCNYDSENQLPYNMYRPFSQFEAKYDFLSTSAPQNRTFTNSSYPQTLPESSSTTVSHFDLQDRNFRTRPSATANSQPQVFGNNHLPSYPPNDDVIYKNEHSNQSSFQIHSSFLNMAQNHDDFGPKFPQGATTPDFPQHFSHSLDAPTPQEINIRGDLSLNLSGNILVTDGTAESHGKTNKIQNQSSTCTEAVNEAKKQFPKEKIQEGQVACNVEANASNVQFYGPVNSKLNFSSAEILDVISDKNQSSGGSSRRRDESKRLKRPQPKVEPAYRFVEAFSNEIIYLTFLSRRW